MTGRRLVVGLLGLAAVWCVPGEAQTTGAGGRLLDVRAVAARSEDYRLFGLEGGVRLMGPLSAVIAVHGLDTTFDVLGGPVEPVARPMEPPHLSGWGGAVGARAVVLTRPRSFVSLQTGRHRYRSGDEDEDTWFVGAAVGQTFSFLPHLEVGWEVQGRRFSGYEKRREILEGDILRAFTDERPPGYLFVLGLFVGGFL